MKTKHNRKGLSLRDLSEPNFTSANSSALSSFHPWIKKPLNSLGTYENDVIAIAMS